MAAIIFHGSYLTPWALLPVGELGCGSVTSCWRRFAEWAHVGVFERLQELLLDEPRPGGPAGLVAGQRGLLSACVQCGDHVGTTPVDRAKGGSKLHLAVEGGGLPLSLLVTGAKPTTAWCLRRCWTTSRRCVPQRAGDAVAPRRLRWKAERTIAWLAGRRRLRVRYDRDAERFFAFAMLACDRLGYNRLPCAATALVTMIPAST